MIKKLFSSDGFMQFYCNCYFLENYTRRNDISIWLIDVLFFKDHIFMGECIGNTRARSSQLSKTFITESIVVIVVWTI